MDSKKLSGLQQRAQEVFGKISRLTVRFQARDPFLLFCDALFRMFYLAERRLKISLSVLHSAALTERSDCRKDYGSEIDCGYFGLSVLAHGRRIAQSRFTNDGRKIALQETAYDLAPCRSKPFIKVCSQLTLAKLDCAPARRKQPSITSVQLREERPRSK